MGCFYTGMLLLMCLTLHTGKTSGLDGSANSDASAIEFGTRLRILDNGAHTRGIGSVNVTATQNMRVVPTVEARQDGKLWPPPRNQIANGIRQQTRTSANASSTGSKKMADNRASTKAHTRTASWKRNNTTKNTKSSQNLIQLPDLQLNRIEPFWPFSNVTSTFLLNNLKVLKDEDVVFPHGHLPDRFKDTTFFFSHVGPNSFEYRAQFHHNHNGYQSPKEFKPFVHEFPEFPKINFPPFPAFPPEPPEVFQHKPHFPPVPNFNQFPFPTLLPPVNQVPHRTVDGQVNPRLPESTGDFDGPFKRYDVVLGDISTKYPKIFRFNEERINIEDFEKQKKLQAKLGALNSNGISSEPENVPRNHLLILHGGIFTVKEPPLYHRKVIRKRRGRFRNSNTLHNY